MKPAALLATSLLLHTLPALAQTPPRTLPPEQGEARLRSFLSGAGGLTSTDVARRAVASSREVAAHRATAAAAKAKEDQTTAGFWPRLNASFRYTRMSPLDPVFLPGGLYPSDPADQTPGQTLRPGAPLKLSEPFPFPVFENNYAVVGSLSVPVSDYLLRWSRATTAAEHSTRAAKKQEEAASRKVAADARIAYYDWIRARGQVIVTEDRARAVAEQVKDARRLFDAGFASRADVLRAESQEKALALFLIKARHLAGLAEEGLRVAMHDESDKPYDIGEDFFAPLPALAGVGDSAALNAEARAQRPELAALAETDKGLQDAEALARTGRYPRLDLAGNVQVANPNQRIFPPRQKWDPSWDASVVLSWTPTDIPAANAIGREQSAHRAELAARRGALLDGLRLEIAQAQSSVVETEAAIVTSKQGLAAAEEGYRVRRELFLAGKSTLVEVIDGEADLTRARLEVLNALVEARIARVRFEHAVGRDGG